MNALDAKTSAIAYVLVSKSKAFIYIEYYKIVNMYKWVWINKKAPALLELFLT